MSDSYQPRKVLRETVIAGAPTPRRGKVRDLYDLGDQLLVVATDRLSAFDVVFPGGIPDKGRILNQLSLFWFRRLGVRHHVLASDAPSLPGSFRPHAAELEGRFVIVEKLTILPIECVVRGYLAGSGWAEYQRYQSVCRLQLPPGLVESSKLSEPIFTPSTKAETGHDENIPFEEAERIVGKERAAELREKSLAVYRAGSEYARERGIIIADTKFEWGTHPETGELVLADEVFTPDSSRFWSADVYRPGRPQASLDKQYVRDYLLSTSWNKEPPAPSLPDHVVQGTRDRYREIYERLTGESWT